MRCIIFIGVKDFVTKLNLTKKVWRFGEKVSETGGRRLKCKLQTFKTVSFVVDLYILVDLYPKGL